MLGCDYPYVTSLLPDGSMEVHELETQAKCQVLSSSAVTPVGLAKSTHGFVVPLGDQKHDLDIVDFPLLEPDAPNTSEIEDSTVNNARSTSLTPTSGRDASGTSAMTHPTRQQKASILAVGSDAIYALAAPTLLQQINTLLEAHKLTAATNLVKETQRKLEQKKRASHSHSASEIDAQVLIFRLQPSY